VTLSFAKDKQTNTRGLQSRKLLEELLTGVTRARDELIPAHIAARKPKIVLKIAPDLDENALADVADAIKHSTIDAVIVSNTTTQRPESLVSGKALASLSLSPSSAFRPLLFSSDMSTTSLQKTAPKSAACPVHH
jgi:dihydroorotate dehydrogenase